MNRNADKPEYVISYDELLEDGVGDCCSRSSSGRVVFCQDGEPGALPVDSAVINRTMFRTSADTTLFEFGHGSRIASEADHTDHIAESGWSVIMHRTLHEVTDAGEIGQLADPARSPVGPGGREITGCGSCPTMSRDGRSAAIGSSPTRPVSGPARLTDTEHFHGIDWSNRDYYGELSGVGGNELVGVTGMVPDNMFMDSFTGPEAELAERALVGGVLLEVGHQVTRLFGGDGAEDVEAGGPPRRAGRGHTPPSTATTTMTASDRTGA